MEMELDLSGWNIPVPTKRSVSQSEVNSLLDYDVNTVKSINMSLWGNSSLNGTNSSQVSYMADINRDLQKVEIAVLATILYMALFGNGVVLLVLRLRPQKLSRMQWFIAHLAFADIFVALFNVLPQLIHDVTSVFLADDITCKFVRYMQVIAMYVSSYVLVMAAVDRYLSICHPLASQTMSPKRVHLMIALAWFLSLLYALPQVFIFSLQSVGPGEYDCLTTFEPEWGLKAYITWVFVSDYVIPFIILAFCYGRICHVVWVSVGSKESASYRSMGNNSNDNSKHIKMRISFNRRNDSSPYLSRDRPDTSSLVVNSAEHSKKPRGHQRGVSKSKMKTIKLTLTVVLCYLVCWAPFFLVNMINAFDNDSSIEHPVTVVCMLLASLNSCTNPWIYMAFSGRPCQRAYQQRNISRSWAPSTHITSAADSGESKTRSSMIDLTHGRQSVRNGSSNGYLNGAVRHADKMSNCSKC
ncbi:cephalotocin receptor 1-like [Biomphalaria glabrata]|uniref:Cephalotocin receptor 1-like n=1 Tax=Biomphalaria glabrata TaxID=6526 RepID=A0A9W2Z4Y5_BIOGL|nr:cephalotocin receptor 1-like [Biomphalaria glabrata]XP_055870028.1 cephalotocin receptor 1-like [Biomphalaria glabrata]XP_055870029.1 cephalotocin receptor 1-like [Biomphalaria glabrata]XP_055870031.1 cephalotocin receptor 1-like [Biomphalaria glabrata]XP_055870032.1 cephalotocin receptor 1-like [Biomphalaria glabrata]XP_055870033.1 cephalotocin receptor 1-like [Biomphalaria glabrata]XP_055870034.1 cephalotocin receptor 1-like [Biomphalaria glabrata]XP_055870035.1 cephalotocin receptor 1-